MSGRVFALLLLLALPALLGGCGKYGRPIRAVGAAGSTAVAPGAAAPAHADDCEDPDHDHSDAEAERGRAEEPEASP